MFYCLQVQIYKQICNKQGFSRKFYEFFKTGTKKGAHFPASPRVHYESSSMTLLPNTNIKLCAHPCKQGEYFFVRFGHQVQPFLCLYVTKMDGFGPADFRQDADKNAQKKTAQPSQAKPSTLYIMTRYLHRPSQRYELFSFLQHSPHDTMPSAVLVYVVVVVGVEVA